MKLALFFLATGALLAEGPRGHWSGAIDMSGRGMQVEVDIDQALNLWIGSITIPDLKLNAAELDNIGFVRGQWSFAIRNAPGSPTFAGASRDGNIFAGTFTQGTVTAPFKLIRSGEAVVEPPKSSAELSHDFLGTWEGVLAGAGRPLRLRLRLASDMAGAKGILVIVDQNGNEIPASAVRQEGSSLDVLLLLIGVRVKAEINKDGTQMIG